MKKVLSLFLSCIFVLGICFSTPVVASAEEGDSETHVWEYSAQMEKAEIVATCSEEGCAYNTAPVTITLNAPAPAEGEKNLYYDAKAKEAKVADTAEDVAFETTKITYELKSINNGEEVYTELEGETLPINAGEYRASITLGEVTVSVEFTIEPKTIEAGLLQVYHTYGGDILDSGRLESNVIVTGFINGDTKQEKISYSYYRGENETTDFINAGLITIKVKLNDGNYTFMVENEPATEVCLKYQINKAVIIAENCIRIDEIPQQTYTGSKITPEVKVEVLTDDRNEDYENLSADEYIVVYDNNENVGTANATVTLKNYCFQGSMDAVATQTFEIIKATPTAENFAFTLPENLTYDDNEKIATVKANTDITGMGAITVKYYDSEGKEVTPKAEGTYTVKIEVAEGTNFNAATEITSDNWKFTINEHEHDWKYSASGATITATCQNGGCEIKTTTVELVAPENLIYDGTEKSVTVKASHEELPVEYTVTNIKATDAGEHTAFIEMGDATAKLKFEISKAVIVVTKISAVDRAYNGTLEVEIDKNDTIEYTGLITGNEVGFDLSGLTGTIADANAGKDKTVKVEGSIVLTGEDAKNYSVSTPESTIVNITPATVTITPDDLSSEQYYDLPDLTYTVTGLIGDDKVETEPTLTTDADVKKTGDDYTITATGATVTNSDNYIIEYATGKMAITEHKNHKVAEDGWKKSVDGTCMVAGKEEGICTLCSEPVTRDTKIDPNNHKLVTTIVKKATCTQTGEAKVTCANGCDYLLPSELPIDNKAHSFASEFTVIEATCTTVGSKFKVCENEGCKEVTEKTEIAINPDAHKNVETINVKQPTCEEKGYTGDEYCNDCKKTFEPGIEVNALGHTESDWIVDKEATFTEDGVRHTACTVCSKELKKEVIAKLTLATPVAKAYNKTGSIKVKWTDVDNALTYNVYRSDFINNGWTKWKKIGTVNQGVGEFSDKNVVAGKQYKYTVKAYNGDYKSSIKTSNKLIFINPIKPALTSTTTGIILKWDTVFGADKYVAYRSQLVDGKWSDWKSVATIKDGKTSTTDTTVESGAIYKYSVRACQGKSYSERKSSATISFLAQPTLKISNTETGIKGSWETINGATGYVITRSEYSDADKKFIATVKLGTAGATVKSFTDKTAKEGVKYKYTVTAISDYGSSVASSGKVLRRLAQPVVTIENANGAIKGKWNQVTGATNYAVYRSEFVDGAWTKWKKLGTAGATAKSFTDKTVKSGVNYKYTVKAINGGSKSSVGASNNVVYLARPEPTAINSIYGVKINWNAVSGAESYIVYRKTSVNEQWSEWQQIGTSSTNSYIDSTAVNTGKYKYTVHAVNGNSLSARKASAAMRCVTTPTTTAVVSGTAITLSWNEIPGATKYVVYRQVLGADGKWSASTKIASLKGALAFSDTTAPAGSTYRYKVYAYNGKTKSSAVFTDAILIPIA